MNNEPIPENLDVLKAFAVFAAQKGHNASVINDSVVIRNVTNPNNNFRIFKQDGNYLVYTICVSPADYEYTAKCIVYLLLAEYNTANANSTHFHINFKVQL
ncbi:MAG: hypothetical protein V4619_08400 [Bacteroidota bacterium]